MYGTYFILLFCIFLSLTIVHKLISKNIPPKHRRPPGPQRLPIVGNIFNVGILPHRMLPHRSIEKLKAKYGPVIWLQLGMSKTVVIQSAKAAEELYKNDSLFADRYVPDSLTACDINKGWLISAPYGEYWRFLRKRCSSLLFSHKNVRDSVPTRVTCIGKMMQWIKEDSDSSLANGGSGEVQLERYLMYMTVNVLSNMIMSKDIMRSKSEIGSEFYEAMISMMEWVGTINVVDPFPFLRPFDPQGVRRNSAKHAKKLAAIINGIVEERIQEQHLRKAKDGIDFLDALLDCRSKEEDDEFTKENMVFLILEMFIAGTETSSTTINWAMAELLRNPESLRKLKLEIDQSIKNSRVVEEDNIANLPYLKAVVKETMRLHPPAPLIPRSTVQDTEFMGYFIPKSTIVLVNAWAIQRDPETWEDPLSFKPERFLDSSIDSKGRHFELIPFGLGRRVCVGMVLGDKMMSLALANLIHTFDWKLPANTSPDTLDMRERLGLVLHKLVPLMVIPTERQSLFNIP